MARLSKGPDPRSRALDPARLASSFGYAWDGFKHAWQNQPNFRLELYLGALAVALAAYLRVDPVPVVLASGLVLGLELVNTAIEALTDRVGTEPHPMAKLAKDTAAAAVLVASAAALLVGIFTFLPPILDMLR